MISVLRCKLRSSIEASFATLASEVETTSCTALIRTSLFSSRFKLTLLGFLRSASNCRGAQSIRKVLRDFAVILVRSRTATGAVESASLQDAATEEMSDFVMLVNSGCLFGIASSTAVIDLNVFP